MIAPDLHLYEHIGLLEIAKKDDITDVVRAVDDFIRTEVVATGADRLYDHQKVRKDASGEVVFPQGDGNKIKPLDQILREMSELGFFSIDIAEEFDGLGLGEVALAGAVERTSAGDAGIGVTLSIHFNPVDIWSRFRHKEGDSVAYGPGVSAPVGAGYAAKIDGYLRRLAKGYQEGGSLGGVVYTGPAHGTNLPGEVTTARLEGDDARGWEWVLNGSKIFITTGGTAKLMTVTARTILPDGKDKLSAFMFEADGPDGKRRPGFKIGKIEEKLGLNSSGTVELVYENCRIPRENLLGGLGKGASIALYGLDGGRIHIGAQAVGILSRSYVESLKYAAERVQFDRPIVKFPAVRRKLADMAVMVAVGRSLVLGAAALKTNLVTHQKEAATAKLYASEASIVGTTMGIQVHGGYGYIQEYVVERLERDAHITTLYEGTSDAQRMVISGVVQKELEGGANREEPYKIARLYVPHAELENPENPVVRAVLVEQFIADRLTPSAEAIPGLDTEAMADGKVDAAREDAWAGPGAAMTGRSFERSAILGCARAAMDTVLRGLAAQKARMPKEGWNQDPLWDLADMSVALSAIRHRVFIAEKRLSEQQGGSEEARDTWITELALEAESQKLFARAESILYTSGLGFDEGARGTILALRRAVPRLLAPNLVEIRDRLIQGDL